MNLGALNEYRGPFNGPVGGATDQTSEGDWKDEMEYGHLHHSAAGSGGLTDVVQVAAAILPALRAHASTGDLARTGHVDLGHFRFIPTSHKLTCGLGTAMVTSPLAATGNGLNFLDRRAAKVSESGTGYIEAIARIVVQTGLLDVPKVGLTGAKPGSPKKIAGDVHACRPGLNRSVSATNKTIGRRAFS